MPQGESRVAMNTLVIKRCLSGWLEGEPGRSKTTSIEKSSRREVSPKGDLDWEVE